MGNPLAFTPDLHLGWASSALWTLPVITFLTYLGVQWWSAWYPGAEPGGGGYVAQRIFSARNEKHSLGATLWFNIAHYALRPWPWIMTGLVALAVYSPAGGLHPNPAFVGLMSLARVARSSAASVSAAPGQCTSNVSFTATFTDNCAGGSIVCQPRWVVEIS